MHILSVKMISWNARRWTGSADHKQHVHSSSGRRTTQITDCEKKRRRIKTGTTAAKTWEDPSKKKTNKKLLFIYIKCNAFKCFYHSKFTGVRLGLAAWLIESGSFLCCAWDPPGCQSSLILFGFPLILPLLWDEHWAPLTSKTCLKHYLALSIKVRAARQGCAATRRCDKAAMTVSQLQEQKVTITVRVWLCFKSAIISMASEGESRWYSEKNDSIKKV